jgi:hypothetical protein
VGEGNNFFEDLFALVELAQVFKVVALAKTKGHMPVNAQVKQLPD